MTRVAETADHQRRSPRIDRLTVRGGQVQTPESEMGHSHAKRSAKIDPALVAWLDSPSSEHEHVNVIIKSSASGVRLRIRPAAWLGRQGVIGPRMGKHSSIRGKLGADTTTNSIFIELGKLLRTMSPKVVSFSASKAYLARLGAAEIEALAKSRLVSNLRINAKFVGTPVVRKLGR